MELTLATKRITPYERPSNIGPEKDFSSCEPFCLPSPEPLERCDRTKVLQGLKTQNKCLGVGPNFAINLRMLSLTPKKNVRQELFTCFVSMPSCAIGSNSWQVLSPERNLLLVEIL